MQFRKAVIFSAALLLSSSLYAQDAAKFEIFGDYTYMQFNPTINGVESRAFNGGGGGAQINFGKYFGVKGDFQGYGSTEVTMKVTSPIPTPAGIIPIGTYVTKGNMFTYLFGPVVQVQAKKARVFGEVLFGGSNTSVYTGIYNATILGGNAAYNPNQHPFTMAFGGGLDLNLNEHVAIRVGEFDWILTRYTNVFTNTNNQNSFRYLGGVILKFGGK